MWMESLTWQTMQENKCIKCKSKNDDKIKAKSKEGFKENTFYQG